MKHKCEHACLHLCLLLVKLNHQCLHKLLVLIHKTNKYFKIILHVNNNLLMDASDNVNRMFEILLVSKNPNFSLAVALTSTE